MITSHSTIASGIKSVRQDTADSLHKPDNPNLLDQCLNNTGSWIPELEPELNFAHASAGSKVQAVFALALRAAATPVTLLILGESGTGKSMLARSIHAHSREKDGPFVTVSCPSLSKELFESDLFGHTRGAFTGAIKDKPGKVALAEGGTLFLDEIGDLPWDIQSKLLRLIHEREYERVGDPKVLFANVRLIAATNKDLEKEVSAGRFRDDLYYRLNVIPLDMPPLRDRIVDLPHLAGEQLDLLSLRMGSTKHGFSDEAMRALLDYSWPGNFRELRNAIEHALIMVSGDTIRVSDFPNYLRESKAESFQVGSMVSLDNLERAHITRILEITSSQEEAAAVLGIDPATLYRKRKRYEKLDELTRCAQVLEFRGLQAVLKSAR